MDRKLFWNREKYRTILNSYTAAINNFENIEQDYDFFVWNEIPDNYKQSFYENESNINPVEESYEDWTLKLTRRPEPYFSVCIHNNIIVSSLSSSQFHEDRMVNLWHTLQGHRNIEIGKIVFLNMLLFIHFCDRRNISAWDVTSAQVDEFLTNNGFE